MPQIILLWIISGNEYFVSECRTHLIFRDHLCQCTQELNAAHYFFKGSFQQARILCKNAAHIFIKDHFSKTVFCSRMPHTFFYFRIICAQSVLCNRNAAHTFIRDQFSKRVFYARMRTNLQRLRILYNRMAHPLLLGTYFSSHIPLCVALYIFLNLAKSKYSNMQRNAREYTHMFLRCCNVYIARFLNKPTNPKTNSMFNFFSQYACY
jgi:hypothetical protein